MTAAPASTHATTGASGSRCSAGRRSSGPTLTDAMMRRVACAVSPPDPRQDPRRRGRAALRSARSRSPRSAAPTPHPGGLLGVGAQSALAHDRARARAARVRHPVGQADQQAEAVHQPLEQVASRPKLLRDRLVHDHDSDARAWCASRCGQHLHRVRQVVQALQREQQVELAGGQLRGVGLHEVDPVLELSTAHVRPRGNLLRRLLELPSIRAGGAR